MDKLELVDATISIVKTNWTQGRNVRIDPERGECFCLGGALFKAAGAEVKGDSNGFPYLMTVTTTGVVALGLYNEVFDGLRRMLSGHGLISWNDEDGRTSEEVVGLLERYRATLTDATLTAT